MGFLDSIFTGANPTLAKDMSQEGALAGYSTGIGEGDTTAASNYYQQILSGDPSKTAEAIAPQTAQAQEGAQQQKNQTAQFGTRGGGTGAATAGIDANTNAELLKLVGGLKQGAAAGAANLGTSNLGMASSNLQSQEQMSQQQMQNYMNSILGKGIGTAAGAAEEFGLGKAFPTGDASGGSGGGPANFVPMGSAPSALPAEMDAPAAPPMAPLDMSMFM